jgi:putative transposase
MTEVTYVTINEAVQLLATPRRTIERYIKDPAVRSEVMVVSYPNGGKGRQRMVNLEDLRAILLKSERISQVGGTLQPLIKAFRHAKDENGGTLGVVGGTPQTVTQTEEPQNTHLNVASSVPPTVPPLLGGVHTGESGGTLPSNLSPNSNPQTLEYESQTLRNPDAIPSEYLAKARGLLEWLRPLAAELEQTPPGERTARLEAAASQHGVSVRSIQRWLDKLTEAELARKQRNDAGKSRLPAELEGILKTLWLMHPLYSANRIRRIIELNDPSLLVYKPYPRATQPSTLAANTIWRFRQRLEADPIWSYALATPKAQREFARIWAGEVLTERANQLWMVDMTRCDSLLYDPVSDGVFRMRVHAVIDVFSGAVPAFAFSREEDQRQTDRMLMLALLRKPEPWVDKWDVWGKPETLYWDNGKVYRSEKSERVLASLGIQTTHSRPYVSHSRGNIERFFGNLHQQFERGLPGYAGPDTTERDHKHIARLLHNTRQWVAKGSPDPDPLSRGERLLTEAEFKHKALLWLTLDYHQQIQGKTKQTRAELFSRTAPRESRLEYDFGDLSLVFSRRERRTVRGNGTVSIKGRTWGMSNGTLARYQGKELTFLVNDLMPAETVTAALPQGDQLKILGVCIPLEFGSLSDEAKAYRRASRAQIKSVEAEAEEIRAQFIDPSWRLDAVLERKSGLPPVPPLQPSPAEGGGSYTLSNSVARLQHDPSATERGELAALAAELEAEGIQLDRAVDDWFEDGKNGVKP